jgi:hypothetical protein
MVIAFARARASVSHNCQASAAVSWPSGSKIPGTELDDTLTGGQAARGAG